MYVLTDEGFARFGILCMLVMSGFRQVADEFTRLRSRDNMEFDINDFNTFDDVMY